MEQTETSAWTAALWTPPTDVLLADDTVIVRCELAGILSRDLVIRAGSDELVVSGVRREPAGPRPQRIDRMEIAFGPFERRIPLPLPVLPDMARARLASGLLEVALPVAEPHRAASTGLGLIVVILSESQ